MYIYQVQCLTLFQSIPQYTDIENNAQSIEKPFFPNINDSDEITGNDVPVILSNNYREVKYWSLSEKVALSIGYSYNKPNIIIGDLDGIFVHPGVKNDPRIKVKLCKRIFLDLCIFLQIFEQWDEIYTTINRKESAIMRINPTSGSLSDSSYILVFGNNSEGEYGMRINNADIFFRS